MAVTQKCYDEINESSLLPVQAEHYPARYL